jgi:hypothetical protein
MTKAQLRECADGHFNSLADAQEFISMSRTWDDIVMRHLRETHGCQHDSSGIDDAARAAQDVAGPMSGPDILAAMHHGSQPATPPPDALRALNGAWADLADALNALRTDKSMALCVDQHRPRIEAALRAQGVVIAREAGRWRSGFCVECGEKWPCTAVVTNSDRKVPHRLAAPTEEERQHEQ